MQPLPYYDKYIALSVPGNLSQTQVNWFIAFTYFVCFLLMLQMVLLIHNCYMFLYKQ